MVLLAFPPPIFLGVFMPELLDEHEEPVGLEMLRDETDLIEAIWRIHLESRVLEDDIETAAKLSELHALLGPFAMSNNEMVREKTWHEEERHRHRSF